MNWLLNVSTRAKLFLGFGLMLAFLVVVIAAAYTGIAAIGVSQERLYTEDYANARDVARPLQPDRGLGLKLEQPIGRYSV